MRIVLGRDEVERLAHQGRAYHLAVVERSGQILALEALEPRGERHVRRARTLRLQRPEPVHRLGDREAHALEQQLACERRAIQLPDGQRRHLAEGTTCPCGGS